MKSILGKQEDRLHDQETSNAALLAKLQAEQEAGRRKEAEQRKKEAETRRREERLVAEVQELSAALHCARHLVQEKEEVIKKIRSADKYHILISLPPYNMFLSVILLPPCNIITTLPEVFSPLCTSLQTRIVFFSLV